ncbi:biotin/lipoyl-binding protein, partial [Patescibacteria group bacterium]|nr:biotin/lipoyl-binding protein [Patescibacteria group bacterium]
MKIRLKKKTIIILSIIAILIVAVIIIFASRNGNTYDFYTVTKGDVVQEISESGIVKKGDIIPLSFKSIGQIEKIFIKAGDEVSRGTVLAKLNSAQLYIQLQQAKANLALAQAELAKLTAGASV